MNSRRLAAITFGAVFVSAAAFVSPDIESFAESSARDAFALELPEISSARITEAQAAIPRSDIRTLRLLILKPYADVIAYGKIYTWVNGEAAMTIQDDVRASRDGKFVTLDLERKPRFRLHSGKNVVEISAVDRSGRSYYASYILLAGGQQSNEQTHGNAAVIESVSVSSGSDRESPTVYLIEPKGAAQLAGASSNVKVRGVAGDDSGEVASVTVNGEPASLSAAPRGRALIVRPASEAMKSEIIFERIMMVSASTRVLTIEAKDRAGNTTRVQVPVRRPEAGLSSRFSGRKFAIVVGVSRYKYHDRGLNDLGYADSDARAVREFLQNRAGGGFASTDIFYAENEQATVGAVRQALTGFLPRAGPNDLIFIFIAGHGAPDPDAPQNLYFLLHDTRVADMPNTGLPMKELQDALDARVRAERVVVFVDTCHSGGLSGKQIVATRGIENNLINLYATKLYNEKGRAVLTSSDVNELSQESPEWGGGHGIFTLALLEGLRGEADANRDHLVTAGELFAYVRDRVRVETAFRQNPFALPGLNAELQLAVSTR